MAKSNKSLLLEDDSIIYAESQRKIQSDDEKGDGGNVSWKESKLEASWPDLAEFSTSKVEKELLLVQESLKSLSLVDSSCESAVTANSSTPALALQTAEDKPSFR